MSGSAILKLVRAVEEGQRETRSDTKKGKELPAFQWFQAQPPFFFVAFGLELGFPLSSRRQRSALEIMMCLSNADASDPTKNSVIA
jgi:hypothetical protein